MFKVGDRVKRVEFDAWWIDMCTRDNIDNKGVFTIIGFTKFGSLVLKGVSVAPSSDKMSLVQKNYITKALEYAG